MNDNLTFVAIIVFVVIVTGLMFYGMSIDEERRDASAETVTVQVIDIDYLQKPFCGHEKSIVRCNSATYVFDNLVKFPTGNVTITMRESWYENEYHIIDWEWLD